MSTFTKTCSGKCRKNKGAFNLKKEIKPNGVEYLLNMNIKHS
jgi:hypothetical protein